MPFTGLMPAAEFAAPRYGLATGATVVKHDLTDGEWGAGFEQENGLCGIGGEIWVWCGPEAVVSITGDEGEAEGRWEKVYPFVVAATDACGTVLNARRPETQQHLLEVLDHLSLKGAERELWVGAANEESKALTRDFLSVGTDMPAKTALAVVEDAMAECLPGVMGTIHMPPSVAIMCEGSLSEIDGTLVTLSGSRVIVGPGYAGQPRTPAIYGTGPVSVHLGPSQMVTEDLAQMADVRNNDFTLRAERMVAVTFDGCCHVGATVTLS